MRRFSPGLAVCGCLLLALSCATSAVGDPDAGGGEGGSTGSGDGGSSGSGNGGSGGAPTTGAGGTTGNGGSGGSVATGTGGRGGAGGTTTGAGGTGGTGGATGAGGTGGTGGRGGTGGTGTGGSGGATGAGGTGGSGGATGAGGTGGRTGALKIMPIGDSVTRATCWRALLWQRLSQNFAATRFDLAGTLRNDPACGIAGYDQDNQGYSSSLITEVVGNITNARTCDPNPCPALADVRAAFVAVKPHVVLMHWGTNDVWNGRATASITAAYSTIIDEARAANPTVIIMLAKIIPMNVTNATCAGCTCAGCPTAIPALNTAITTFAAGKSTTASPIIVVDQYTGFDANADTRDGVHPNTSGSQKMADKWYAALVPFI